MTPEEAARFVLSDCQDPELRAKAWREADEMFAEAMRDPVFKARWDAGIKAFSDDIDDRMAEQVYRELSGPSRGTSFSEPGQP